MIEAANVLTLPMDQADKPVTGARALALLIQTGIFTAASYELEQQF